MDNLSAKNNLDNSSVEIFSEQEVSKINSNVGKIENKATSETVEENLLIKEEELLDCFHNLSMDSQHQNCHGPVKYSENTEGQNVMRTYNDVASSPIDPNEMYQNDKHETFSNAMITSSFCKVEDESNNLENFSAVHYHNNQQEESPLPKVKIHSISSNSNKLIEQFFPHISKDITFLSIDPTRETYLESMSFGEKSYLTDSNDESTASNSPSSNSSFYTSQQDSSENEKQDFEDNDTDYYNYKILNTEKHSERKERKDTKLNDIPLINAPKEINAIILEQSNNQNDKENSDKDIFDADELPENIKNNSSPQAEINELENSSFVSKMELFSVASNHQIRPIISSSTLTTNPGYERNENITVENIGINMPSEDNENANKEISDQDKVDELPKNMKNNSPPQIETDALKKSSIKTKKDIFPIAPSRQIRPNFGTKMFNAYPGFKRKENSSIENIGISTPSEETSSKILRNVEFYFTNFNILKNNFLLKHVRKNKEGFVSLKLVTSFRKVKAITRDWRVVAHCIESSKMLELNLEKNKVRRIEPVPKIEDTSFGKTVLVFNLPFLKPSSDNLKELFSKFGPVVNAEIMTSKSKNFNIYHKKCLFFNRDVASQIFGMVEFENYEDLQRALKDEEGYLPKDNIMNVLPLVTKYFRPKPRNFRSNFSYPRNNFEKFNQRFKYFRDIHSTYGPIDIKSNKSHSSEENLPRRNYCYHANQERWCYPPTNFPNYYLRQNCPYCNQAAAYNKRYTVGGQSSSESWRPNRQLKSNTSMNIESRLAPSIRKVGTTTINK